MSDFAALGLSQLCSFKIKHGGENVSFFRENSNLWFFRKTLFTHGLICISMSIKRRILNCYYVLHISDFYHGRDETKRLKRLSCVCKIPQPPSSLHNVATSLKKEFGSAD